MAMVSILCVCLRLSVLVGAMVVVDATFVRSTSLPAHHHRPRTVLFQQSRPILAVITEPTACDSDQSLQETLRVFESLLLEPKGMDFASSISNNSPRRLRHPQCIDLIVVRIDRPSDPSQVPQVEQRIVQLVQQFITWSQLVPAVSNNTTTSSSSSAIRPQSGITDKTPPFWVVLSSEWQSLLTKSNAHGLHVKERHQQHMVQWRRRYNNTTNCRIVGTSAHSLTSALHAQSQYQPDYLFVGTCFPTQSHPEKTVHDLEGPQLPGQVVQALQNNVKNLTSTSSTRIPPVLAIGGITVENCPIPLRWGANGVAVIRAITQNPHPYQAATTLQQHLQQQQKSTHTHKETT